MQHETLKGIRATTVATSPVASRALLRAQPGGFCAQQQSAASAAGPSNPALCPLPRAPPLMVLLCKGLQRSPPKYIVKKCYFFPVYDFVDFIDLFFFITGLMLETGSCFFLSRKVAALYHKLQFALPADNSAPAKTLVALCLFIVFGGRGKEPS